MSFVIIRTGEFVKKRYDLRAQVNGEWLSIVRFYGNQKTVNDAFGHKWDSNILARVEETTSSARVYTYDHTPVIFSKNGGGYEGPSGQTLIEDGSGYTYTKVNGATYQFDTSGAIQHLQLRTGQKYQWAYDGMGRLTGIEDGAGSPIYRFEYDADLITKAEHVPSGRAVVYEYDTAAGDLTRVTGSCGTCGPSPEQRYEYDASHNLVTIRNADAEMTLANHYDAENRVTRQEKDASTEAIYDYSDHANGHYTFTLFSGITKEFHYNSSYELTKTSRSGTIDGQPVTHSYTYEYNDNGGQTRTVTPSGKVIQTPRANNGRQAAYIVGEGAGALTRYQYAYGSNGNVLTKTQADGTLVTYAYNAEGMKTQQVVAPTGLALTESWQYGDNGRITRHTDAEGTVTELAYDANAFLTQRTVDPGGLALTTVYHVDSLGQVTKRIDPRGSAWIRFYNAAGDVTKSVSPTGRTVLGVYDANQQLVTKTVQDAETSPSITRTTTYEYDPFGNLTRRTEPAPGASQRHFDFAYDGQDRRTYRKLPTGEEHFITYAVWDEVHQRKVYDSTNDRTFTRMTYRYDGDKHITRQTDANGHFIVKSREYDQFGRLTRETGALDHYTVHAYDAMGRVTRSVFYDSGGTAQTETHMAYDAAGRAISERELASPGGGTSSADRLVEMAYDDTGRLTRRARYLAGATTALTDTTYDAAGRVITRTRSDGPTIALAYDAGGNLLTRTIDPGAGGLQLTLSFAYDSAGRQTRTTNPDLTYRITLYDGLGRVTKMVGYDSGDTPFAATGQMYDDDLNAVTKTFQVHEPATSLAYDAQNDPAQVMRYSAMGRLTARQDANGNQTEFAYDDLGRRITTTDPVGNERILVYDDADRVLTRIRRDHDGASHTSFEVAFAYDAADRRTKTIRQGPDGDITATGDNLVTTQWYDALGQVTQTEDPAGMRVARHHDAFGEVTRTEESVEAGGIGRITDRDFDRAGRLTRLTAYRDSSASGDGTGIQHTDYRYSKAGVVTRVIYPDDTAHGGPDRGYEEFFFDAALRLTRKVDQNGDATDTVYDAMGRRLTVARGTAVDSFTYTDWGAIKTAKRGTSANPEATSAVTRHYDGLMRLTRESQAIEEDPARHVDYAYDTAGNLLTLGYPGGTTIATSYDANHRADLIHKDGSQIADYDYVGQRVDSLIFETGANDLTQSHRYDGAARLTRLGQARGGSDLATFGYRFDAASNITSKTFEHRDSGGGAPSEDYSYDPLHRLTRTTFGQRLGDPYEGFVYDDLGNHLTQDDNGTAIAGAFNAVNEQTQRGGTPLSWSRTGNLTEDDEGQQYVYDRQNMLTEVRDSAGNLVASYTYDALGRRIVADDGTDQRRFYYSGFRIVEETDGAANVQRAYVWGAVYIDELLVMEDTAGAGGTAGADYFALRHHNYNVVALTDSSGAVVERYDYDPYGQRFVLDADFSDDDDGTSDYRNPIGHQGLHHDAATGLVHNRARTLHPRLGRFMQRDPLGYVDGMGLYLYVDTNPIAYRDPIGLQSLGASDDIYDTVFNDGDTYYLGGRPPESDRCPPDPLADLLDSLGKAWNLLNTAVGLGWGGLGLPFGADIDFGNNAIEFTNHPFMFGAITLGNTISYAPGFGPTTSIGPGISVGDHERQHTYQGQILGPAYLPANVMGGIMGMWGEEGHWHGPENFMESGPQSIPPVPFPGTEPCPDDDEGPCD